MSQHAIEIAAKAAMDTKTETDAVPQTNTTVESANAAETRDTEVGMGRDTLTLHKRKKTLISNTSIYYSDTDSSDDSSIEYEINKDTTHSGISLKAATEVGNLEDVQSDEIIVDRYSVASVGPHHVMDDTTGPDFFSMLGDLPSLSQISERSSELQPRVTIMEMPGTTADHGRFVDPLTGEIMRSSSSEHETSAAPLGEEEEEEEKLAEEEEELSPDVVLAQDDDLLQLIEMDEEAPGMDLPKIAADNAFETFLDMETPKAVIIADAVDIEALAIAEKQRAVKNATAKFIDDLINHAVHKSEYVDPKVLLRQQLDKSKMLEELRAKLLHLDEERKICVFLNSKTVDFFRRKKAYRSILDDNPDTIKEDKVKFKATVIRLDCALGEEESLRLSSSIQIDNLESDIFDLQKMNEQVERDFEKLIEKTLLRDSSDKFKIIVEHHFKRIQNTRNEISAMRTTLIERQHSYATLVERLNKLENLGNDLRMRDFERLQTENQAMDKKIEERNAELSKVRARCNADLHRMAHMKEKEQMLRNTTNIQQIALKELVRQQQICREHVYNLKLDRSNVRKAIQEYSFQGGLLDKPALMLDFDITMNQLNQLRKKVNESKAKYKEVQQKIEYFEKQRLSMID